MQYQKQVTTIKKYNKNNIINIGTGSGSLSTSIARCIAPHGKLYTFEFNRDRVDAAIQDFKATKIDDIITVTWRDVYQDGFQTKGNTFF